MGDVVSGVGLAAAIGQVRRELQLAMTEGEASPLALRAGPVELEFDVTFTATGGGGTGVNVWVVSINAKGEVQHASSNRLRVTLTPVDRATGEDQLVGSEAER